MLIFLFFIIGLSSAVLTYGICESDEAVSLLGFTILFMSIIASLVIIFNK